MWAAGIKVQLFHGNWIDLVLTVIWITGVTNAFNLLDNMDGLSAGIAAIAAGFFFVIAAINGQIAVAALSIALAGCALGFLRHNFHPARIYMGDAGSLFLGFLLAVIGLKLKFQGPTRVTFMVPLLVLGAAIFDTTLVTITRLIHRRSPFAGGRDHLSHRLVFLGLPVPVAVGVVYASGISLGWVAVVMSRIAIQAGFILMGLVLTLAVAGGVVLARVPVYETSKRKRMMLQEVVSHEVEPQGEVRALR
jgi:UDP-GlcNAc:undecaprenyl-phosphate GlcNAc-1-phosphate transferase